MKICSFCLDKYHQDNPRPVSWANRIGVKLEKKTVRYKIKKKKKGFENNDNNIIHVRRRVDRCKITTSIILISFN